MNEPEPPYVGTWVQIEEYYGGLATITLVLTENSFQMLTEVSYEGYAYFLDFGYRAKIEVSGNTVTGTITDIFDSYYYGDEWVDVGDEYYGFEATFDIEGDTLTLTLFGEVFVFTRQ